VTQSGDSVTQPRRTSIGQKVIELRGQRNSQALLQRLIIAMEPLRRWSGKVSNSPSRKICSEASESIRSVSESLRPVKRKQRTLNEAIKILDQRIPKLRIGEAFDVLNSKYAEQKLKFPIPKLEQQFQIGLAEYASDSSMLTTTQRGKFLEKFKEFRHLLFNEKRKREKLDQIAESFEPFRGYLENPSALNLKEEAQKMILLRHTWLDSWAHPTHDLRKLLVQAGHQREEVQNEVLRKVARQEHIREQERLKKRRFRARKANKG